MSDGPLHTLRYGEGDGSVVFLHGLFGQGLEIGAQVLGVGWQGSGQGVERHGYLQFSRRGVREARGDRALPDGTAQLAAQMLGGRPWGLEGPTP